MNHRRSATGPIPVTPFLFLFSGVRLLDVTGPIIGVHRRVSARGCRSLGRAPRHGALAARTAAGRAVPLRASRAGGRLRARRADDDLGRCQRRHRPGPGPRRRSLRWVVVRRTGVRLIRVDAQSIRAAPGRDAQCLPCPFSHHDRSHRRPGVRSRPAVVEARQGPRPRGRRGTRTRPAEGHAARERPCRPPAP